MLWNRSNKATHYVIEHFNAYQESALAPADAKRYRQHLAACQQCREWVERQVALVEGLRGDIPPRHRLSDAGAERVQRAFYKRMRRATVMNSLKVNFQSATVAVLFIVTIGGFIWWQFSSGDTAVPDSAPATPQLEKDAPEVGPTPSPLPEPTLEATPLPPTPEAALEDLALAWQDAYNAGDVAALLGLYAPDAAWSQSGLPLAGEPPVAAQLAYELALNSRLELAGCQSEGEAVACQAELSNDWLVAAGVEPLVYETIDLTFGDNRILAEQRVLSPESEQVVAELFASFMPWLRWRYGRYIGDVVTADGELISEGEQAAILVEVTAEWAATGLMTNEAELSGVWELSTSNRGGRVVGAAIEFREGGEGRVAADARRLATDFDPDDPATGYLIEYWFEGSVLHFQQVTPGAPLVSAFYCNDPEESKAEYLVEVLAPDEIRFRRLDEPCVPRYEAMGGANVDRVGP